jgi:hypothetical protein
VDGTFDVVCDLYTQLWTIHGITDEGVSFPLVYALLCNKEGKTYEYAFKQVRDNIYGIEMKPSLIIMDFENGEKNGANKVFPSAKLQGCHFHLSQSLLRNYSSEMTKEYKSNPKFALEMRKFQSLAFLPEQDVERGFHELVETSRHLWTGTLSKDCNKFYDYVFRNYVGSEYNPPTFPIKFWNVYQRVLDNLPRTNNAVEAWNRRFGIFAGSSNLPIYRLISTIMKEQEHTTRLLVLRCAGENLKRQDFSQRRLNHRLVNKCQMYNSDKLAEFLQGVAHNMSLLTKYSSNRTQIDPDCPPRLHRNAPTVDEDDDLYELPTQRLLLSNEDEENSPPPLANFSPQFSTDEDEENNPPPIANFDRQYSTAPSVNRKRKAKKTDDVIPRKSARLRLPK